MAKYERVMNRVYKFYDNPKSEETYALDYCLIRMIVPRLELFIEKSNSIIDWEAHKKSTGVDVMQTCKDIIEDFKFYLDNSETDDITVYEENKAKLKHGFDLLGDVITHLGW